MTLHFRQEPQVSIHLQLLHTACTPLSSYYPSEAGEGSVRRLIRVLLGTLGLLSMLVYPTPTFAKWTSTIQLRARVSVVGPAIILNEIADLKGDNDALLEHLGNLILADAPPAGSFRTLTRGEIQERLARNTIDISQLEFVGAASTLVRRKTRPVNQGELEPLIRSHLTAVTPWRDSELEIRSIRNIEGLEVPLGDVTFRVPRGSAPSSYKNLSLPIEISAVGTPPRTIWVIVEVGVRARTLVAARPIAVGTTLVAEDLKEAELEIRQPQTNLLRSSGEAAGKTARRSFGVDELLLREFFDDPRLVRAGQTVRLRLMRSGIQINTIAKAEQNGKLGDLIRVRQSEFQKSVQAQVTGTGEVQVH